MTEDRRLDPLEEEALRRVRSRVVQAVRDEQRQRARPSRRPIMVFALAAVSLIAVGIATAVNLDRDDQPARVDVVDDRPDGRVDYRERSRSSDATTTIVVHPSTTTTEPLPPRATRPETFVGVTHDGRLVVVDVATGEEIRELARLGDPTAEPPEEGPGPNVIVNVAVDSEHGLVYYEECCEPISGVVWAVPLEGGEPVRVAEGGWPAVSGDGQRLANVNPVNVTVQARDGAQWVHAPDRLGGVQALDPALSLDGSSLAFTARDPEKDRLGIVVVDADDESGASARTWRDPQGIGWAHPTFRRDGDLVVVQQSSAVVATSDTGPRAARVVDPDTGKVVSSFQYPAPVNDQDYDASGTWLLVTLNDGQVMWYGGGTSAAVATGYVAASW